MHDDEVAGIIDVIETEGSAHDPVTEPVSTEAVAEGAESTTATQTEGEDPQEPAPAQDGEKQVTGDPAENKDTKEPSQSSEEQKTETPIDDSVIAEASKYVELLPPEPQPYDGPQPQVDPETGQIVNMTPEQYATYMRETTKAEMRHDLWVQQSENASLEAAEKILPEIRTNPAIRQLVENARLASVLSYQPVSAFEAAKTVREALGISPEALSTARAEGKQSAKTSIEIQKVAAPISSAATTNTGSDDEVSTLQKRIKRGDDEAVAQLLDIWDEKGTLK